MLVQGVEQWRIRQVDDPSGIEEICRFRVDVWRSEGSLSADAFPDGQWRDPIDARARHWVVRDADGRLAAAGRLSLHETLLDVHQSEEYTRWGLEVSGKVANPDRVVVARFARSAGLGRLILDAQDEAAQRQGATCAVRQASPRMVQLLKQRGWRVLGPATDDPRFPGVSFQAVVKHF